MVAVVGHVEVVHFLEVERVPRAGEICHARGSFELAAGGGAVAARQLLLLEGQVHFFTALGDDEPGERARDQLAALGISVHASRRRAPQRLGTCFLDAQGERTITVVGERLAPQGSDPLPWDLLDSCACVYFTAGDQPALRHARRAGVLVSTSRVLSEVQRSGVELDALVGSRHDRGEAFDPATLEPRPGLMVLTAGGEGGQFWTREGETGHYRAEALPGPTRDAYGCGDSFAAGLTWALGRARPLPEALQLAARCGATCLTGRGPYERQFAP